MKDSKRRLIIIIEHVLIIAALLFGFCRYSHMNDFTKSKWQEGFSGDVVYDMMENYVYPGVPLTDVVENLGSETNKTYDKEKYLSLFGLDGAEYDVMIYNVKKAVKDGSAVSRYFVVIHDGSVVVKTMLVEEID